jgi:hypothetical protein
MSRRPPPAEPPSWIEQEIAALRAVLAERQRLTARLPSPDTESTGEHDDEPSCATD